jgi:glutamine cyclotransferase
MMKRDLLRNLIAGGAMAFLAGTACNDGRGEPPSHPQTPVATPEVVRAYPHDPEAFTQGLVFHGGRLLESTGQYGRSTLREVVLETGAVVRRVNVPESYFAEGLALVQDRLYQLTWQQGMGFIYDLGTFERKATFPYDGEGWGLATDGASLILSDGSNVLRFIDPGSFRVQRTLDVLDGDDPVHQLNELEWVRGEIWANVWHQQKIARIDPATGKVKSWLDLSQIALQSGATDPEAVPNGIAFDEASGRLFVTGKLWPALYEIRVPGVNAEAAPAGG